MSVSKDPYLIEGAICEVWNKNTPQYVHSRYYDYTNKQGYHFFAQLNHKYYAPDQDPDYWECYRVLNTEWTHAPDWAVCSVVFGGGQIYFSNTIELKYTKLFTWKLKDSCNHKYHRFTACGWTKESNRYDKSWDSLRLRPVWAGGKA